MSMINISDNVHLEIIKKRTELLENGIKMRIQDIADKAILNGLNSIIVNKELTKD